MGYGDQVMEMLPDLINSSSVPQELDAVFLELIKHDYGDQILRKLPKKIDFTSSTGIEINILIHLLDAGYKDQVMKLVPAEINPDYLSKNMHSLLLTIYHNEGKYLLSEKFKERLRSPITINSGEIIRITGPTIEDQINSLPIDFKKMKKNKNGDWYFGDLDKDGSKSRLMINFKTNPPTILFKNFDIEKTAIDEFKNAQKILPGYLPSGNYPELHDGVPYSPTYPNRNQLREVYFGPNLRTINLSLLPTKIAQSIESQRNYILLTLGVNEIDHGHSHDGNFNVRFLLEKDGQQLVMFDPEAAITKARDEQYSIIPIVILRDWDKARSSAS
jgi:hypothetical protein